MGTLVVKWNLDGNSKVKIANRYKSYIILQVKIGSGKYSKDKNMSKLLLILALLISQDISLYCADSQIKSATDTPNSSAQSTPYTSPQASACVATQFIPDIHLTVINNLLDTESKFEHEALQKITEAIKKVSAQDLNNADETPLIKAAIKHLQAIQANDVEYGYTGALEYIIRLFLVKGADPEKIDKDGFNFLFYISENQELINIYNEVQQIFKSKAAEAKMAKELGIEAQTPRARRASMDKANQPLIYEHYDNVSKGHIDTILKDLGLSVSEFMKIADNLYRENNYNEFLLELSEGGSMYKIKSGRVKPGRKSDLARCKKIVWK